MMLLNSLRLISLFSFAVASSLANSGTFGISSRSAALFAVRGGGLFGGNKDEKKYVTISQHMDNMPRKEYNFRAIAWIQSVSILPHTSSS